MSCGLSTDYRHRHSDLLRAEDSSGRRVQFRVRSDPGNRGIRGVAEGTAATFNWASNLIVSLTFLTLVEKLGASSTFFLYALASVASWLFAYYFVPETKGRTLEQIEAFWRARHRAHQPPTQIS